MCCSQLSVSLGFNLMCFSTATYLISLSRIYIYLLQALLNSNLLTHSNSLYKQLWSFKCQCSLAKGITSSLKKCKPMTLDFQLVDKGKFSVPTLCLWLMEAFEWTSPDNPIIATLSLKVEFMCPRQWNTWHWRNGDNEALPFRINSIH